MIAIAIARHSFHCSKEKKHFVVRIAISWFVKLDFRKKNQISSILRHSIWICMRKNVMQKSSIHDRIIHQIAIWYQIANGFSMWYRLDRLSFLSHNISAVLKNGGLASRNGFNSRTFDMICSMWICLQTHLYWAAHIVAACVWDKQQCCAFLHDIFPLSCAIFFAWIKPISDSIIDNCVL